MYDLNKLKNIMQKNELVNIYVDYELENYYTGYIADIDTTGLLLACYDHTFKIFAGFVFIIYFSGFEVVPYTGGKAEFCDLMKKPFLTHDIDKKGNLFEAILKYCKEKRKKCRIVFDEGLSSQDFHDSLYIGCEEAVTGFISEINKYLIIPEYNDEDKNYYRPSFIYTFNVMRIFL